MINMAVVSLKDIIKYLIKITILIAVVIGVIKYFSIAKDSMQEQTKKIKDVSLLSCLDTSIPAISATNYEEENKKELKSLYTLALETELGIFTSLETKENNSILAKEEKNTNEEEQNANNEKEKNTNNVQEELKNEQNKEVTQAQTGLKTEVQNTSVPEKYSSEYHGVKIRNEANYKLTEEILIPNISINTKNVLIYHTHTCESYTPSAGYEYKQTGTFRTTDRNYSVVRVGRELNSQLKSYGFNVIHNETYHDYPSYTGSYSNSLKTITNVLEKNKDTDIVIDLHRDAIGNNSYAPTVKIGEEYVAQMMFVIRRKWRNCKA